MTREGKTCAGLAGRDTAYVEEAADFGCMVGGESEVIENARLPTAKQFEAELFRLIQLFQISVISKGISWVKH